MTGDGDRYALIGVGAAHIDRIGYVAEPHRAGVSNPGRLISTVGGGVFNALRAAHMRGIESVGLISARGGDPDGAAIAGAIDAAGLHDCSAVFLDRRSASYTAIIDEHGDVVSGIADMEVYETALPRQFRRKPVRERIAAAEAVLCDANMPADAIEAVATCASGPVFAMAISPSKADRLLPSAAAIDAVFLNQRELAAMTGGGDLPALRELGFTRAVVSRGPDAVTVLDHHAILTLELPPAEEIIDVTGAGDALAGATIAALLENPATPLAMAARDGIAAAQVTLRFAGPVAPALKGPDFDAIRSRVGAPAPAGT